MLLAGLHVISGVLALLLGVAFAFAAIRNAANKDRVGASIGAVVTVVLAFIGVTNVIFGVTA